MQPLFSFGIHLRAVRNQFYGDCLATNAVDDAMVFDAQCPTAIQRSTQRFAKDLRPSRQFCFDGPLHPLTIRV